MTVRIQDEVLALRTYDNSYPGARIVTPAFRFLRFNPMASFVCFGFNGACLLRTIRLSCRRHLCRSSQPPVSSAVRASS